jgi:transposase
MKAYSLDLRLKIVQAFNVNPNKTQVAKTFGVSVDTVQRYLKLANSGGSLEPKPIPGRVAKISKEQYPHLETLLRANPNATLEEILSLWAEEHAQTPTTGALSRTLKKMGWSYKKKVKSKRTQ